MRRPTWAGDFPRLHELCLAGDTANEPNYFANFEDALRLLGAPELYKRLEDDLQQLDVNSWRGLKKRVVKYTAIREEDRGWDQFFHILSEAKGYLYLKSLGCDEIRFIPEEDGVRTPDL